MPRFAANLSVLFNEVDFMDRFAAAARAGFTGVECQLPYAFAPEDMAAQLKTHGLTQVLHNLPAGDWAAGERGIACHPDRIEGFRAGVERAMVYATALGCERINCLAGIAPAGADPGLLRETFLDNLRYAADRLAGAGIRLLIEPINTRDVPGFFLNRSDQAIALIEDSGSSNVWLQYDVYHMQIMEGDLAPTIEKHLDRIGHIQISDTPGRHEPGSGAINYPFLFDFLDRIGYRGWVGAEYRPLTTTIEGLGWFRAAS